MGQTRGFGQRAGAYHFFAEGPLQADGIFNTWVGKIGARQVSMAEGFTQTAAQINAWEKLAGKFFAAEAAALHKIGAIQPGPHANYAPPSVSGVGVPVTPTPYILEHNGSFTMLGDGQDCYSASDNTTFACIPVTAIEGEWGGRVVSVTNLTCPHLSQWAKVGIMARGDLSDDAPDAYVHVIGAHQIEWQARLQPRLPPGASWAGGEPPDQAALAEARPQGHDLDGQHWAQLGPLHADARQGGRGGAGAVPTRVWPKAGAPTGQGGRPRWRGAVCQGPPPRLPSPPPCARSATMGVPHRPPGGGATGVGHRGMGRGGKGLGQPAADLREPWSPGPRAPAPSPWGLYVHVPFCPYKCAYCDFVAVGGGARVSRWQQTYVAALRREAAYWLTRLQPPQPPISVFYGGGTPTQLGAECLAALHAHLAGLWGVPAEAEVTVECNPGTVEARGLARLRAVGVNRLSIGLQSPEDALLARVGRRHTYAQFLEAMAAARTAGFDNVNVDLMLALPGQELAGFAAGLARVLELAPEHVSVYALQLEEGTALAAAVQRGAEQLPGEDADAAMYAAARAALAAAGYEQYEVSNFARPGFRCRHNLLYWENADYLGLGIGAHAHWQGRRWANTARLAPYCALPAGGAGSGHAVATAADGWPVPPWVVQVEPPDAARARSEGAFLGLRLLEGIDEATYARRYGVPLRAAFPGVVEDLLRRGLLQEAPGGRLRLAPQAVPVANRVFAAFV